MKHETNILKELRLILCGWCFGLALSFAPKDDPEGIIVVESIGEWALKTKLYMRERGQLKKHET